MSREITIAPLTAEAFAPFGEVLEAAGRPRTRSSIRASAAVSTTAPARHHRRRAGISLFKSEARRLPYRLDMVERHPLGSRPSCR
jgi:ureidoglycolate lyase